MYPAFYERGVEVLAISTDAVKGAREMAELYDLEFPVLADADATVTSRCGVYNLLEDDVATPAVFLVGIDGTIRWSYVGKNIGDRPPAATISQQVGPAS